MKTITRAATMQRQSMSWRQEGLPIAIVPTMGYLHSGHESLIKQAREIVKPPGKVIVSIFVNPTQFGPQEDFEHYPRSDKADLKRCRELGTDIVFKPSVANIYPQEPRPAFSSFVTEESLSQFMEGRSRPVHFRGVATIVSILFNIAQPTLAVFGEKDFQQTAIVKQLVRDLHIPVKIVLGATVREPDGLALSSRNKYLSPEERSHAPVLWRCIQRARRALRSQTGPIEAQPLKDALIQIVRETPLAKLDYVEFFDPKTLHPAPMITRRHRIALSVRFGTTRLIDNGKL